MGKQLQTISDTDAHTDTQAVVVDKHRAALRPNQEHFAQLYASHGNAARAFREAFNCGAMTPGSIRTLGYRMAHEPAVAARVRALLAAAAETTTISARARMVRLQEIIEASPDELVNIVAEPCPACWSDPLACAAALDRGVVPDTDNPQEDCASCKGHGARRVVVTPTDQLSPAARKLLKSVRQKADGSIEVHLHDQLAASDQLNKMQGVYVDRSVSVSVTVPALKDLTQEQALDFLDSLSPAK